MMKDLLFKNDEFIFSYRVAGILIYNGKVLLQTADSDPGYAFPGGHVSYGETHAQTLEREFAEETGLKIQVHDLKWIGELFFPWGNTPCQQICLYYAVSLCKESIAPDIGFDGIEEVENKNDKLHFHWIPINQLCNLCIYPAEAVQFLQNPQCTVQHFIYREE